MEFTAPGLQPLVDHQGGGVGEDGADSSPEEPGVIIDVLHCCPQEEEEACPADVLLATGCFNGPLCQQASRGDQD